jgi:biopolymer transport protein ExbB/TolQ
MDSVVQQLRDHAPFVAFMAVWLVAWICLVTFGVYWLLDRLSAWWDHRHGRRTPAEDAAYWRRHLETQLQIWHMEAQIHEEQLPEEEQARRRKARGHEAEIHREARRRLGLPEEDS